MGAGKRAAALGERRWGERRRDGIRLVRSVRREEGAAGPDLQPQPCRGGLSEQGNGFVC
jgi:hypothetical protein